MASSAQLRVWWRGYLCAPAKMVRVNFPTSATGNIGLLVAAPSKPVWEVVARILREEGYWFEEMAGGTYNCRPPSLHANGIAVDINPSRNPFRCPMVTDMPSRLVDRIESIRANGKEAVVWGGRWPCSNPPDPMHYQINVSPSDCAGTITWDQGGDMPWTKPGDPVDDMADARAVNKHQGWSFWRESDFDYDENDPKYLDERTKIITARMIDWMMRHP